MKFKSEVELQGDQKIENEFLIFIIVIHFGRQKANLQDPSRIKNYVLGAEPPPPPIYFYFLGVTLQFSKNLDILKVLLIFSVLYQ